MIKFEPETSPSLLLRIRNTADSQSWLTFEMIYAPVVRNFCRRRGIQEADVDDLVQDVMSTVAKAIRRFDYDPQRGRFRAWFGRVTTNKVKTFLAKRSERRTASGDSEFWFHQGADFEASADWNATFCQQVLSVACDQIRSRLEAKTWACFEMTWLLHLPATEVAERLSIPIHTVYVNKSRVLKQLEVEVRAISEDLPMHDVDF
jgi:RNA polymerase sigma factor (sigma-70 family)